MHSVDVIGESGEEERRNLGGVYGLCACLSAALWGTVNFKITDAFSFMSVAHKALILILSVAIFLQGRASGLGGC